MADDKGPKPKPGYNTFKIKADTSTSAKAADTILPDAVKQYDYLNEYVASPKYRQRLTKMINAEKLLGPEKDIKMMKDVGAPLSPEMFMFNSELLKGNNPLMQTSTIADNIIRSNNTNLSQVKNRINMTSDLSEDTAGQYDSASSAKDIRLNPSIIKQYPTTVVHELSHASNDGKPIYSEAFNDKYVKPQLIDYKNSNYSGYVQTPTELKSRIDVIRYLGNKTGLYDAGKKDFTTQDYDKMIQNKEITSDPAWKQLHDQLPKERRKTGMIWFMNNIAKIKDKDLPNQA